MSARSPLEMAFLRRETHVHALLGYCDSAVHILESDQAAEDYPEGTTVAVPKAWLSDLLRQVEMLDKASAQIPDELVRIRTEEKNA